MRSRRAEIIVNADDYGYTPGVSAGIRRAYRGGLLSSTTAMMTTPDVTEAVERARRETPAMPIGVHLVLTYGHPLSPPDSVSTLVGRDGRFHPLTRLAADPARAAPDQVHQEWRRQIERLLALGVEVEHLDSHHHSAYLHPDLAEVLLDLAATYRVPVRRPPPVAHPGVGPLFDAGPHRRVWSPDLLLGGPTADPTPQAFADLVDAVPEGAVAEIMVHPGVADGLLRSVSSYAWPRQRELAMLLDPSLRTHLRRREVELTTFGQAANAHT